MIEKYWQRQQDEARSLTDQQYSYGLPHVVGHAYYARRLYVLNRLEPPLWATIAPFEAMTDTVGSNFRRNISSVFQTGKTVLVACGSQS